MYVAREDACRAAVRAAVTPAYAPALWSFSLIATTMYQTTQHCGPQSDLALIIYFLREGARYRS